MMATVATLNNAIYSWWVHPVAVVDGSVTWVGSVGSAGQETLTQLNRVWRVNADGSTDSVLLSGTSGPDDHNAAAIALNPSQPNLLVFYSRHGNDNFTRYQTVNRTTLAAGSLQTLDFGGRVTYAQVLQTGDTIHLVVRNGSAREWQYRTTTDWGSSWGSVKTLLDFGGTGSTYLVARQDRNTPTVYHVAVGPHPTNLDLRAIHYCQIDVSTGEVRTSDGTVLGNLNDAGGPQLAPSDLEVAVPLVGDQRARTLDVGAVDGAPAVAYAIWDGEVPSVSATYRVQRLDGSWKPLDWQVPAGPPFGYVPPIQYVGGVMFAHGDTLLTSRHDGSAWSIDQWTWTGGTFVHRVEVARSTTRLIRPYPPQGTPANVDLVYQFVPFYGDIYELYTSDLVAATIETSSGPEVIPVASVQDFASVVSGSHRMLVEARVVTDFQVGNDPDGQEIPVLDGQVILDGTADVRGQLHLTTQGLPFPRRAGDLLLPDGVEVFVRRGVDAGDRVLWSPLGYFRIETDDQDDAPDGPITLTGYDRMKAIVDSGLLQPREFGPGTTFGAVFAELVHAVYPSALIQWDDATEFEPIGRPLVVEQSRYEALRTLAAGRGKIMYWDGLGVLRIETAPDPSQPVWEVRSGSGGVLTRAKRRITRTDVVNAVVVRSQGTDTLAPALAVAVDDGPQSITRFSRFGVVPEYLSVPAHTSAAQAQQAAIETLRRRAGLPYQVEFAAVPNPALRPWHPVRVTLRDGSRERHVIERVTIPLTAAGVLTARTREQRGTLVRAVAV